MKKNIILCLALLMTTGAWAEQKSVSSPDGRIQVNITDEGGQPRYEVQLDGQTVISPSALGLKVKRRDLTKDMTIVGAEQRTIREEYDMRNIKQSHVNYEANELELSLKQKNDNTQRRRREDQPVLNITFRVSNRDVAFRYTLLPQGQTLATVVEEEATEFRLPQTATSFLCPQSKPMGGFARTSPSYETAHSLDEPVGRNGWGEGYTFPCLFKTGESQFVLISETGTDGNYCGCRLLGGDGGTYRIGFPQEDECNGWGTTSVSMALPGETPWRTITLGGLQDVVETTVTWDVVKPKYAASKQYEYGKGTWSWIIGMDSSCNFDEQKRYIDFAADLGYRSVLIDALWDKQIGYDRIAELARYGKTKGVGLYLWYNSNGSWNDAPQSPRGKLDKSSVRRKEMAWMQQTGILGIKVDFFGGDKQNMMQLYEDILTDANEFGLLVIFHGCTLPRGWERMFPNYAASEAILASENLHFGQGFCDSEARQCGATYPFTRNVVGSMDFGGSALNKFYGADNQHGTRRMTSDVYALATAVLYQSPVQHFALAPNNLTDAPAWAVDFMKQVPTTWDELRFIDGYPGRYVVFARRHGNTWYVAGINAEKEPKKLTLSLPMLNGNSNVKLYINNNMSTTKLAKKQTMKVEIPSNGGVVVVSEP